MTLNFLLPIIFFVSLGGILYLIFSKVPILTRISQESIANQETFLLFLSRLVKTIWESLDPKKVRIYALTQTERVLNRFRVFFLKAYHAIEHLTKKTSQELKKTEWEHSWFSKEKIERQNGAITADSLSDAKDNQESKKSHTSDV